MGNGSSGNNGTAGSPMDIAEATFQLLAGEPNHLVLDGVSSSELPSPPIPLPQLRELLCNRRLGNATRDLVWRELATRARRDGASWMIGAVGMALPALRAIAGRITRGYVAGDPRDIDTEILTAFLEALHSLDLDRPNIRPRLCERARRAGEKARRTAEAASCRRLPFHASATPQAPWSHPDFVLADAVAKGVLTELDAELIGRTRLEDLSLAEAAAQLGLTAEAAKKRRQRAEPLLCEAVMSGQVRAGLSLTITSAAPGRVEGKTPVRSRNASDTRSEPIDQKGGRGPLPGSARVPLPPPSPGRLYPCGQPCDRRTRRTRRARRVVLVLLMAVALLLLITAAAHAQPPPEPHVLAAPGKKPASLGEVIDNLRNWLIGFLVGLATLMGTVGGLRYLLAGGDPGEVAKAKNTLKSAALGYAIAALAPLLVAALKSIVGV